MKAPRLTMPPISERLFGALLTYVAFSLLFLKKCESKLKVAKLERPRGSCRISGQERRQSRSNEQRRQNFSYGRFWSMSFFALWLFKNLPHSSKLLNQNGYLDVVKFLVKQGAKIDQADDGGTTVLHMACAVRLFIYSLCYDLKSWTLTQNYWIRMVVWRLSSFSLRKVPMSTKWTTLTTLLFRLLLVYVLLF